MIAALLAALCALGAADPNRKYPLVYHQVYSVDSRHHEQFIQIYKAEVGLKLSNKYQSYFRHHFFSMNDEVHIAEWMDDSNVWKLQVLVDGSYRLWQQNLIAALNQAGIRAFKTFHQYFENMEEYQLQDAHYSQNDQLYLFDKGPVWEKIIYKLDHPDQLSTFLDIHDKYITKPVKRIFYRINTGYQMWVMHDVNNEDPLDKPGPVYVASASWFSSNNRQWIADGINAIPSIFSYREYIPFTNSLKAAGITLHVEQNEVVHDHHTKYDYERAK